MTARKVVLVWENFGPTHFDRIRACAKDPQLDVVAIEFFGGSKVYLWEQGDLPDIHRVVLSPGGDQINGVTLWWRLIRACLRERPDAVFLCHYSVQPVFWTAVVLLLFGVRSIAMIDSKFDDKARSVWREAGKAVLLAPYAGALAGSRRTIEYLRFLGFKRRKIVEGFDSIDVARFSGQTDASPAAEHAARDFLVVARLVEKKNLAAAIQAFAKWRGIAAQPRKLRVIGYGHLGPALAEMAVSLGVADDVIFVGKADSRQVAQAMRTSLCLILPSYEEQFGLVVIEALALGLPALVSSNAGAIDGLIDNGVNGWIVDPYRPEALIAAMTLLDRDEAVWSKASVAALASAQRGDVHHFVSGVRTLARLSAT